MTGSRPRLTAAIQAGIATELNNLGRRAGCQPLAWSMRLDGDLQVTGCALAGHRDVEVPAVLQAWADLLNLTRQEQPSCAGTTEYRGHVEGLALEVWGVHDRDAFEHEAARGDER